MVRQLSLEFAYRKTDTGFIPESDEIALVLAFILAESNKKEKTTIKRLSQMSIPFWIVQVSNQNSILLSAAGEIPVSIEITQNRALGPVKRILSSEIGDPKDIPEAVDEILPLLKKIEPKTYTFRNLQFPEHIITVGNHLLEPEPGITPQSLDLKIDSQAALRTSEQFQQLVEDTQTGVENMKEIQKLSRERLTDRLKVLDNVISSEKSRMEKQYQNLENITNIEVQKLTDKKSDIEYEFNERRVKELQTIVSSFAQGTADLEQFYNDILADIKKYRRDIAEEKDDIKGALKTYRALIRRLKRVTPKFKKEIKSVDKKSKKAKLSVKKIEKRLKKEKKKAIKKIDKEIREHRKKLKVLKKEHNANEKKLQALKKQVVAAVKKIERTVNDRLEELDVEFLNLKEYTFENDSIKNLAPLTLVYIKTYVVTYSKGNPLILSPIFIPDNRIMLPFKQELLDSRLDKEIHELFDESKKSSPSFKDTFEQICIESNALKNPRAIQALSAGINELWQRQLLPEGLREDLTSQFMMQSGKCPECGADIEMKSKFCPECGSSLN